MNTLMVGYDLNKTGQDYEDLVTYLKSHYSWWHHLDSTWLIRTEMSASEMRDALRAEELVDSNDEVLVINVTGREAAWHGFKRRGSTWLKENL